MILVAKQFHLSIEERHTRHERRYRTSIRSSIGLPQEGERGFDGGMLSSDAGVLLLRGVEKRLGIAARLASCLKDKRDPDLIVHTVEEMLRLRMFAIAAGYEDADDCDSSEI